LALVVVGVIVWLVLQSFQILTSEVFRGFQDLKSATLFGGVISWALTVVVLAALWFGLGTVSVGTVIAVAAASTAATATTTDC